MSPLLPPLLNYFFLTMAVTSPLWDRWGVFYNVTVRPCGAMQEHQNVNTALPLHAALFEVERGPCFQLSIVPLERTVQLNSHKRTESDVFYCGILLKEPSEVTLYDLWAVSFCPSEFSVSIFPSSLANLCIFLYRRWVLLNIVFLLFLLLLLLLLFRFMFMCYFFIIKLYLDACTFYSVSLIPEGHCFAVQDQCLVWAGLFLTVTTCAPHQKHKTTFFSLLLAFLPD